MKIQVLESGEYASGNMIDVIYLEKDKSYEVIRTITGSNPVCYLIRAENGKEAYVSSNWVTIVKEPVRTLGTENRRFMYVLVRSDMAIEDILVQSTHAAYESGLAFKNHADRTTIIVLQVKDIYKLREAYNDLQSAGVQCTIYQEQTLGLGYTAIGTEALTAVQRHLLKKYQLLKVKK